MYYYVCLTWCLQKTFLFPTSLKGLLHISTLHFRLLNIELTEGENSLLVSNWLAYIILHGEPQTSNCRNKKKTNCIWLEGKLQWFVLIELWYTSASLARQERTITPIIFCLVYVWINSFAIKVKSVLLFRVVLLLSEPYCGAPWDPLLRDETGWLVPATKPPRCN